MASHGLPSLATLRLGAATGMPGTNADGKRPVKASRGEDAEDASPQTEPAMLLLTHLPRDVIGKIVTQAALDARKAEVPASAICAWMKRFCTSAHMQGVPCDDYWYKLALVAFGVNPDAVPRSGQLKWMRNNTKRSLSWREFFGSVCDAFFAKPTNLPFIEEYFKSVFIYNSTQRELDTGLGALLSACSTVIQTKRNLPSTTEAIAVLKADWDLAMRGKRSALFSWTFWPLMGLLLLRGAEPWTYDKYAALDHEIYVAIMATKGDALSAPERLSTDEAIRRIADAVARGANVSFTYKSVEPRWRPFLTLTAAVEANNPEIIKWLLDHGAHAGPGLWGLEIDMRRQYEYMRQLITKTVYDVDEWQVDFETTEQLMVEAVSFFESAKDKDQNLFLMGMDILNTALEHMEENGFESHYQSFESMDVGPLIPASQVQEENYSDTDRAVVKGFIYSGWKSIFDDYYQDE